MSNLSGVKCHFRMKTGNSRLVEHTAGETPRTQTWAILYLSSESELTEPSAHTERREHGPAALRPSSGSHRPDALPRSTRPRAGVHARSGSTGQEARLGRGCTWEEPKGEGCLTGAPGLDSGARTENWGDWRGSAPSSGGRVRTRGRCPQEDLGQCFRSVSHLEDSRGHFC